MHRHLLGVAGASIATITASAAAGTYSLRLVTKTGQAAPSTFGGTFTTFGRVSLNASGQIAFGAYTTGPLADSGFWMTEFDVPQSIELVVGEDFPVPGAIDRVFGEFHPSYYAPHLTDAGDLGFSAPLDAEDDNTAIFRMIGGTIELLARPGDPAPLFGPGVTYKSLGNLIAFNDTALLTTTCTLEGPGVHVGNDTGFVVTSSSELGAADLVPVLREDDAAPGLPGTSIGATLASLPLIANDGQVALDVSLNGASATTSSRWRGWPGALECVVKGGDPSPIGGTFEANAPFFWSLGMSADGVGFGMTVQLPAGDLMGLWHAEDGTIEPIALEGQASPIGDFVQLSHTNGDAFRAIASDGSTAFMAKSAAIETKDSALFRGGPNQIPELLLREGDSALGYGPTVVHDDFFDLFGSEAVAISDAGWIVVSCAVRGPGITDANDRGVWAFDDEGTKHLVAREGMLVSLGGGIWKTVETIQANLFGGANCGRRSSVNDRGDVALILTFTDGSEAVVVAQPPEACLADRNGDGLVDAVDLSLLLGGWGPGPVGSGGDIDRDGDTDANDLALLLGAWGTCRR